MSLANNLLDRNIDCPDVRECPFVRCFVHYNVLKRGNMGIPLIRLEIRWFSGLNVRTFSIKEYREYKLGS